MPLTSGQQAKVEADIERAEQLITELVEWRDTLQSLRVLRQPLDAPTGDSLLAYADGLETTFYENHHRAGP